jgi:hypothetical protein
VQLSSNKWVSGLLIIIILFGGCSRSEDRSAYEYTAMGDKLLAENQVEAALTYYDKALVVKHDEELARKVIALKYIQEITTYRYQLEGLDFYTLEFLNDETGNTYVREQLGKAVHLRDRLQKIDDKYTSDDEAMNELHVEMLRTTGQYIDVRETLLKFRENGRTATEADNEQIVQDIRSTSASMLRVKEKYNALLVKYGL